MITIAVTKAEGLPAAWAVHFATRLNSNLDFDILRQPSLICVGLLGFANIFHAILLRLFQYFFWQLLFAL